MIDHVSIKVKDLEKSKLFYEKIFAPLGWKLSFGEKDKFYAFQLENNVLFEIFQYKGMGSITPMHIAFRVTDKQQVHDFHQVALASGATSNGEPGPRRHYTPNYYACFVHDLDGHNIEAMWDDYTNHSNA